MAPGDFNSEVTPSRLIILPDSTFKVIWNIILVFVLLLTATFVPFQLAFLDDDNIESLPVFLLNTFMDSIFIADIMINFFSAYERPGGLPETRLKVITTNYATTWFFFDLIAAVPSELINLLPIPGFEYQDGSNRLAKLARTPRMYRLIKLLRLFKLPSIIKLAPRISKVVKVCKFSNSTNRMIQSLAFALFCVHVVGCVWFLTAKYYNFSPETWVVRRGVLDADLKL